MSDKTKKSSKSDIFSYFLEKNLSGGMEPPKTKGWGYRKLVFEV